MKKKLTLRLDDDAIETAKQYARERGTSVSKLVEGFFVALSRSGKPEAELSPLVKSISGIARDTDLSESDYYEYLDEKHG